MGLEIRSHSIDGEIFFHCSLPSLIHIYEQIFKDGEYRFSTDAPAPHIIDCGAHYGISTIYFKREYPEASIIAFEPDVNNIEVFKKNIRAHHLAGVKLVEAAISDFSGEGELFGEFGGSNPDSQGNSLMQSWGARGNLTSSRSVKVVRLSDYIEDTVDFIKLNVEGSELSVIQDLHRRRKLSRVKQIYIQFHQTDSLNSDDQYTDLLSILSESGFDFSYNTMDIRQYLPDYLEEWAGRSNPKCRIVRAMRTTF